MRSIQFSDVAVAAVVSILFGNVSARVASPVKKDSLATRVVVRNPQGPQPTTVTYNVDSVTEGDGAKFNIGASGGVGVVLTHTESYEVSYTIEVGADLGLDIDEIFSAGASASISKTTAKGSEDSAQLPPCPASPEGTDQWTCSGAVTPHVVIKSGTVTETDTVGGGPLTNPFTVQFPRVTEENILFFQVDLCSCPNKGGQGSPMAPPLCPQDC